MKSEDLAALDALHLDATPSPWHVGRFDDEHFMSAISLEASVTNKAGQTNTEVIAATLIQQPSYVVPSDDRWTENANLIAEMRNTLPELLRLAAIGLAAERGQ
jgi:hypothetical protein